MTQQSFREALASLGFKRSFSSRNDFRRAELTTFTTWTGLNMTITETTLHRGKIVVSEKVSVLEGNKKGEAYASSFIYDKVINSVFFKNQLVSSKTQSKPAAV